MSKVGSEDEISLNKLRKVVGNGCKLLAAATHTDLKGYCIVIHEDAVLSSFKVNGVESLSDYGFSAVTLKAGSYFVIPEGCYITHTVVDSGSVIIYNL